MSSVGYFVLPIVTVLNIVANFVDDAALNFAVI